MEACERFKVLQDSRLPTLDPYYSPPKYTYGPLLRFDKIGFLGIFFFFFFDFCSRKSSQMIISEMEACERFKVLQDSRLPTLDPYYFESTLSVFAFILFDTLLFVLLVKLYFFLILQDYTNILYYY